METWQGPSSVSAGTCTGVRGRQFTDPPGGNLCLLQDTCRIATGYTGLLSIATWSIESTEPRAQLPSPNPGPLESQLPCLWPVSRPRDRLYGHQNYSPFWIPITIWHLIFRVPQKGHDFENHPYVDGSLHACGPSADRRNLQKDPVYCWDS